MQDTKRAELRIVAGKVKFWRHSWQFHPCHLNCAYHSVMSRFSVLPPRLNSYVHNATFTARNPHDGQGKASLEIPRSSVRASALQKCGVSGRHASSVPSNAVVANANLFAK